MQRFEQIWFRTVVPRAASDAFSDTQVGDLVVNSDLVSFERDGQIEVLKDLKFVSYGRKGTDFGNRWVEVQYYDDAGHKKIAFIKDGRWRGWRPIVTKSNEELVRILMSLSTD
jgi:hypothetical protein